MIYLYISVAFLVLAAAGFGVSRLWRWVNYQIDGVHDHLSTVRRVIHERVDGVEKAAKADLNSIKDHTTQAVLAARSDVQRVEQLFKQHALAVQEDTNKLVAQARQIHDNAVVGAGRLAKRVERL